MGVWPPGAGLQGQAPNHPMLLRSRGVVVSDGEKAAMSRQVSDGKMSNSESPLTHRKVFQKLSKRVQVGGLPPLFRTVPQALLSHIIRAL